MDVIIFGYLKVVGLQTERKQIRLLTSLSLMVFLLEKYATLN